ncbi:ras association domain-containing protein 5-like [Myripristis murdjan]|uniref:ras association domain-containing protein 5-like n=1 Tax=Myripristis murdjan TaxID=586833 RepID=UPI00117612DF|nr:ras association domain-containing protein 5-like [Myripristis murdjan]
MFNAGHHARKYSPTHFSVTADSPVIIVQAVVQRPQTTCAGGEAPEDTPPPSGVKMRLSKSNKGAVVMKAARRHASPLRPEPAWSEVKPPEGSRSPGLLRSHELRQAEADAAGDGLKMDVAGAGGPPRSRKRGFKPPHVRTIFTPREKDPRVREESGAGHTFEPGGAGTWCDVCCQYILQHGLTCTGCKYTCHAACRDRVSLDCHPVSPSSQDQLNNNNTQLPCSALVA